MHCSNALLFWYLFVLVVIFFFLFVCSFLFFFFFVFFFFFFFFVGGGGGGYRSVTLNFVRITLYNDHIGSKHQEITFYLNLRFKVISL